MFVWCVGFATIPVGIFGLCLTMRSKSTQEVALRIAATTIIFGIALYFADLRSSNKSEYEMTIKFALIIGLARHGAHTRRFAVRRDDDSGLILGFSHKGSANSHF